MTLYYLSFATESSFLGAAFVCANDSYTAVLQAHELGINPGGEVMVCAVNAKTPKVPSEFQNRLMTREDLDLLDAQMLHAAN